MIIYKAITNQYAENFEAKHEMYFFNIDSAKEYMEDAFLTTCEHHNVRATMQWKRETLLHFPRFRVQDIGFAPNDVSSKEFAQFLTREFLFSVPFAIVEIYVHS